MLLLIFLNILYHRVEASQFQRLIIQLNRILQYPVTNFLTIIKFLNLVMYAVDPVFDAEK